MSYPETQLIQTLLSVPPPPPRPLVACGSHAQNVPPLSLTYSIFCYSGSKLTKGILKLADTLTKTAKGKSSTEKQATSLTSTTEIISETDNSATNGSAERNSSTDGQVSYVDRPSSITDNLLNKDDENKKDELEVGVENEGAVSDDGNQDGGYLVLREATVEEKEVELKVQQKIEALKKGEEPVSYCCYCYCYCSCLIFSEVSTKKRFYSCHGLPALLALSHWDSIPCCLNHYVAVEANK